MLDLIPMYALRPCTCTRRLQDVSIQFTDYSMGIEDEREAIEKQMNGLGSLLRYRALHQKVCEVHGSSVPKNVVDAMMTEVNLQGLEERGCVGKPKRPQRKNALSSNVSKQQHF